MCVPLLLKVFLMMCVFNPKTIPDTYNCVKAFDICVNREEWRMEESGLSIRDWPEEKKQEEAVSICEDELFNRQLFSEYYTDSRCGWSE